MPCRQLIARGRVQGVGFRWYVTQCAIRNLITGYVQNKSDGSVFIIACGTDTDLAGFAEQVRYGTSHAVVESLEETSVDHHEEYNGFQIR